MDFTVIQNAATKIVDNFNAVNTEIDGLKERATDLEQEVAVLDSRMDLFTALPEGATTNDAALEDIKVGFDGTVYEGGPGDAVRAQVSQLSSEIGDVYHNISQLSQNTYDRTFISGTCDTQHNHKDDARLMHTEILYIAERVKVNFNDSKYDVRFNSCSDINATEYIGGEWNNTVFEIPKNSYGWLVARNKYASELTEEEKAEISNGVILEKIGVTKEFSTLKEQMADIYIDRVITENMEVEPIVTAMSYSNVMQNGSTLYRNHYLTLLHYSDVHGNKVATKSAVAYANKYKNIDAILCTGDSQLSNFFDNKTENGFADTVKPYIADCKKPYLYVLGNHDCGKHFQNGAPASSIYNYYMADIVEQMGANTQENKCYYYKDFDEQKIRLIVLNEYESPRALNGENYLFDLWNRFFQQAQIDWLVDILSSIAKNPTSGLPNDYSVVIALHQQVYQLDVKTLKSNFSFDGATFGGWSGLYKSNQDNTLLRNIIDAFISKTKLTKTYDVDNETYTYLPTNTYTVTVNADFTDRENSNFICFLSGHSHRDVVGYVEGCENKVLNIGIGDCSEPETANSFNNDLPRLKDTRGENVFNIVSFDTDKKQIKLCRVGAYMPYNMIERKYTVINYGE